MERKKGEGNEEMSLAKGQGREIVKRELEGEKIQDFCSDLRTHKSTEMNTCGDLRSHLI